MNEQKLKENLLKILVSAYFIKALLQAFPL